MTRVLIVDDARYARKAIIKELSAVADYEITEVDSARNALTAMAEERPDCVITDLLMQDMGGVDLLKEIKYLYPSIPVIVITADIQEATQQQCLELGAADFVQKSQLFKSDSGIAEVVARILDITAE